MNSAYLALECRLLYASADTIERLLETVEWVMRTGKDKYAVVIVHVGVSGVEKRPRTGRKLLIINENVNLVRWNLVLSFIIPSRSFPQWDGHGT